MSGLSEVAVFLQRGDGKSDAEGFWGADGGVVDCDDGLVERGDAAALWDCSRWWG